MMTTSLTETTSLQVLMRDMNINEQTLERRRQIAGIQPDDLKRIAVIRELIQSRLEEYVGAFFDYLAPLEEARMLLSNRTLSERARRLKAEHVASMVQGEYGTGYVLQRLELGVVYARGGLEVAPFLGAFQHLFQTIGASIMRHAKTPQEGFESFAALEKVAFMDLGIIQDVLAFERLRTIRQQQDAIRELSTPVLQVRDRMLLLPIIGVIDTHRARLITDSLLTSIRSNRAKVVVMDITGVATIDSKVANHLLQTVSAARLMGAEVLVTGMSGDVAQSLVALGIDLTKLRTIGDLQGGLEEAELLLGYRVLRETPPSQALNGAEVQAS